METTPEEPKPQDHLPKKPTKAEIEEIKRQLAEDEKVKGDEALSKIQEILDEYGLTITVQHTVVFTKK